MTWDATLINAAMMLAGGIWYALFSLSLNSIFPFRAAEQILGECIQSVAEYLELKADFYAIGNSTDKLNTKIPEKQVEINEEFDH
ncbi:FUSC family membrane protein, partial [Klebsiella pneumoniae]|uniref:FUSC family membrane protein n=1 Tax=Klebsiella pneumoniae TaxID=573 RepID=UPI0027313879